MKEKLNIAVLFGGCSPEYEVSLQSAAAVIRHMDRERFTPIPIGITRQGDWYCFEGGAEEIAADTWHTGGNCAPVAASPSRTKPILYQEAGNHITEIHVEAAFPVLHGKNGEDGTVQGLFELMGVPVVGCGVLASALCIERYPAGKERVTGIAHEPWHFRYVGAPHAESMARQGLTLEEYLA